MVTATAHNNNKQQVGQGSEKKAVKNSAHALHYAIAEYGKVLALKNRHEEALQHYREAIRRAVSLKAPEVFFRHYTQCVLESLELTGSYSEVIEFCLKADEHYQTLAVDTPLHRKDHGSVLERCAMMYIRSGNYDSARACLADACTVAGKGVLPLAEEVLGHLNRGLSIDGVRLTGLQNKHKYFVVRRGMVDEKSARPLGAESLKNGSSASLMGAPV